MNHCEDNSADRVFGAAIEDEFERILGAKGLAVHRFQKGRSGSAMIYVCGEHVIAPDVGLWYQCGSSVHEVKGKYPTARGEFGLEQYRLEHYKKLMPVVAVWYSIKVTARTPKGEAAIEQHCPQYRGKWITANFARLLEHGGRLVTTHPSWINGQREDNVPQWFWPCSLWRPCKWELIENPAPARQPGELICANPQCRTIDVEELIGGVCPECLFESQHENDVTNETEAGG